MKNTLANNTCKTIEGIFENVFLSDSDCKRRESLIKQESQKNVSYNCSFTLCPFHIDITENGIWYLIESKRYSLTKGTWYACQYVLFEDIPENEYDSFMLNLSADFTMLLTAIKNIAFLPENVNDEDKKSIPYFLADSYWTSSAQTAPVALHYPDQVVASKKIESLMQAQCSDTPGKGKSSHKYFSTSSADMHPQDNEVMLMLKLDALKQKPSAVPVTHAGEEKPTVVLSAVGE